MDGINTAYVIQTVISLVIALICYLMKRSISDIDKKVDKSEKEVRKTDEGVKKVESELSEFKLSVAKDYVTKEDFNETTGQIMNKLDKIMDLIMEINKK